MFILIFILTGCNFIDEKKAEGVIRDYYQAIIDDDYEKAFELLKLYDYDVKTGDGFYKEGTTLSHEEAKAFYLEKVNVLKKYNYKLIDFEIIEVEYEDGHSFWHQVKLTAKQNGEEFEWNEVSIISDGKLVVGERDDSKALYRDGRMNFEIDNLIESETEISLEDRNVDDEE